MNPRQRQCLDIIRELTVDGVPPTFEAIKKRMGLASKSGVHRIVTSLRERGVITNTRDQWLRDGRWEHWLPDSNAPNGGGSAMSPELIAARRALLQQAPESIPFDDMAAAVIDLINKNGRVYTGQVRAALILAYSGVKA